MLTDIAFIKICNFLNFMKVKFPVKMLSNLTDTAMPQKGATMKIECFIECFMI